MTTIVSRLGAETLVNSATIGDQNFQQITALTNGGFVVTWQDSSQGVGGATGDSSGRAIKAQLFGADGARVGVELPVNTATADDQFSPQITALTNGGFVVTWQDFSQGVGGTAGDNNLTAVKAQVFAADGSRVGTELLVNTATVDNQGRQQIVALAGGGFVVTWEDTSLGVGGAAGDGIFGAVKAQVFAADGTRIGTELLVNTATDGNQDSEQIAALASGGFVVTWQDASQGVGGATGDSDGSAVKAQMFRADGTRVGTELLVNTATASEQVTPQITALAHGGFAVAWADFSLGIGGATGDSSGAAVKAQMFTADGSRIGSELLVNTAKAGNQGPAQIVALSDGGMVVTWEDASLGVGGATGDASGRAVKAQVFAADSTRIGAELLVNSAILGNQSSPLITALPTGGFVVTWDDASLGVGGATGDASGAAVKAQVFAADGTRIGAELLVNSATTGAQLGPQVSSLPSGDFVVAWVDRSLGIGGAPGDSTGAAIKAQVFTLIDLITGDGADNLLIGTALAETIQGLGGNDTLIGLGASDRLDGAAGDDTAIFAGSLSSYALDDRGDRIIVTGADGGDTLTSIEHLRFADGTIDVNDGNPLFDTVFYMSHNLDVFHAGANALAHYHTSGIREGRDPNAFFDTSGYLAVNRDVAAAGINPLDHFHQTGWKEGRDPGSDFDTTLYLLRNPDVAAAGIDPLEHFLQFGRAEGRQSFAAVGQSIVDGFDAQFYLLHNPDVAAAGLDPLRHYSQFGFHEGRNPNAQFDSAGYLSHYADVAAAGINPLQHYEQFGWLEGRDPSAGFDTLGYLAANPDVAAAHINPLDHFLNFGIYEGRVPVNDGLFH